MCSCVCTVYYTDSLVTRRGEWRKRKFQSLGNRDIRVRKSGVCWIVCLPLVAVGSFFHSVCFGVPIDPKRSPFTDKKHTVLYIYQFLFFVGVYVFAAASFADKSIL